MAEDRITRTSNALRELGEGAIELVDGELDEFDDDAHNALAVFDECVPVALYLPAWSWLVRRRELQKVVGVPDPDTGIPPTWHRFGLPPNEVGQIQALYQSLDEDARPVATGWRRIHGFIYADFEPCYLEYLEALPPEQWPPVFGALFRLLLLSRLALQVLQDVQMAAMYQQMYDKALKDTRRVDAQSGPARRAKGYGYLDARFGSQV